MPSYGTLQYGQKYKLVFFSELSYFAERLSSNTNNIPRLRDEAGELFSSSFQKKIDRKREGRRFVPEKVMTHYWLKKIMGIDYRGVFHRNNKSESVWLKNAKAAYYAIIKVGQCDSKILRWLITLQKVGQCPRKIIIA